MVEFLVGGAVGFVVGKYSAAILPVVKSMIEKVKILISKKTA